MGVLAVEFRATARNWWVFLVSNKASFEGRRDGNEGQGAGVVQIGVDGGGNVGNAVEHRCFCWAGIHVKNRFRTRLK
jgi:hypothetical protein